MCWMALIPLVVGVVGGMKQGEAAESAAASQSSELRQNSMFANDAAAEAKARGRYDADIQRMRTQQMIGTQRAAGAASGGDVNAGSLAEMQDDTAMLGELDALTIENNAAREAYGYKVQAIQGLSNARAVMLGGKKAKQDSILGGVMSGVSGAAGGMGGGGGGGMSGMFSGASGAGTYGTSGVAVNTAGYRAGVGPGR